MSVTLTRLRSFVVLARTGSFAKAAKAVGRSQPAITDQIRKLEEALAVKLFHRQTRAVSLTSEGEVLFHRTEGILRDLDNVLLDFARVASLEVGEVRVGATPTLACYIVPEIIGTFRRKYAGIRVAFSDQTAAELETQVETRQLDSYFGPKPSPKSTLRFQFVAADSYVIVVPKGHKLAERGCSDPREIVKYPLLLMCRGTYVRDEIDRFFKKHSLKAECAGELSNHFTLGGLVEAGCGITVLPRLGLPGDRTSGHRCYRRTRRKFRARARRSDPSRLQTFTCRRSVPCQHGPAGQGVAAAETYRQPTRLISSRSAG